ncbi:phage tail length tape measure family protein [Rhodanobacter lindaniclasticus]
MGLVGAFGPLVAVVGLFAVAAFEGYQQDQLLNRSIIATGNYAGVTTGQVRLMADAIGAVTGRGDNAREALQLLIGFRAGYGGQPATGGAGRAGSVHDHRAEHREVRADVHAHA